jgi:hypothetical protein
MELASADEDRKLFMRSNLSAPPITGRLVARALRHSWRVTVPDSLCLSVADFDAIAPLLYDSGAAALGWRRIEDSELASTPSGELLHQAYRLLTLQAAIHETKIHRVFKAFRALEIEPILIKGWAMARYYPQPGLRPYGDIDLIVRPRDLNSAQRLTASDELRDCRIDLHARPFELADRLLADLYARSFLAECGGELVRVLSDEDHLALVSIHLLKHGAWRPLWLCDVAMLLESLNPNFAWHVCLGANERRRNWIRSAIGLAIDLLGAIPSQHSPETGLQTPRWLSDGVLGNWAEPFTVNHEPHNHRKEIKSYLTNPRGFVGDLRLRWPDPIMATVLANGSFGNRRLLRYQIHNCLKRAARLMSRSGEPAF